MANKKTRTPSIQSTVELRTIELNQSHPTDTLKIGLDASVDSTGLSLIYGKKCALFLFQPALPPEDDASNDINYVQYNKIYAQCSNSACEKSKMHTMRTLSNKVNDAIDKFLNDIWPNMPLRVQIAVEGAAFGYMQKNSRSLIELVMFRAVIQDHVYHRWPLGQLISFDVLSPKSLKKEFTGDGNADKLKMIEHGIAKFVNFHWCGKVDDAIDAFALASSTSLSEPTARLW